VTWRFGGILICYFSGDLIYENMTSIYSYYLDSIPNKLKYNLNGRV